MQGVAEKASAAVEQVGKYAPIAELGRGGMATAYLTAFSGPGNFNKLMVVKRLRPALAAESDFLKMFLDEARLAARIDHPNIVHTSEVGYDGAHYFIAMEFVDGQPLEHIIRRTKSKGAPKGATPAEVEAAPSIPLNLHLHIITKVLEALDFAHQLKDFDGTPLNVVHRDVSPHNVMVTYDGHVKLLDFGIAKAADSTTDTRTGFLKGKCAYMAPEQFGGEHVDRRADLFSVGIMLWQAITGRRLWRGLSDTEIFTHLAKGEVPSPATIVDGLDEKLEKICMKALATTASERYATAAEFQMALEDYIAAKPDLRASPRDLGKFVGDLFQTERAKIQALVETQLTRSKRSGEVMNLSEYFGNSGSTNRVEAVTEPTAPGVGSRLRWLLAIGALTVGILVAAVVTRRKATPVSAPPTPMAQVTIRVQPTEAKVSVDDVALSGSPPSGSFPLDNVQHKVRVEAPGYTPRVDTILLDSSQTAMDVALERVPAPAPSTPSSMAVTSAVTSGKAPKVWWHPGVGHHPTAAAPTAEAPPTAVEAPPSAPPPAPSPPPRSWPTGPPLDKTDPWAAPKQ